MEIFQEGKEREKQRCWMKFFLFSLASVYTHYYALVAIAFLYLMLIIYEIWKRGITWKKTLSVSALLFLCYLPWMVYLLGAFGRTSDDWWLQEVPKISYCIEYLFSSKISKVYVLIWGICFMVLMINTYKKKVSEGYAYAVTAGIVCIAGTIMAGQAVSLIWRPMLQLKYVYVVSGIAWLTFSILLKNLKYEKIVILLILGITWIVGIPNYYQWTVKELQYTKETNHILNHTQTMQENDILVTNSGHLEWTILEYYYPENECFLEEEISAYDLEYGDWLFWNTELEEYEDKKVAEGAMGPYNYVYVYRME